MAAEIAIGAEVVARGLPPRVEDGLVEANTFANPEYKRRERLGLWLGDTPRYIGTWHETSAGLVVPRGAFPIVVRLCRDAGVDFDVHDRTVRPPLNVDFADRRVPTLVGAHQARLWMYARA